MAAQMLRSVGEGQWRFCVFIALRGFAAVAKVVSSRQDLSGRTGNEPLEAESCAGSASVGGRLPEHGPVDRSSVPGSLPTHLITAPYLLPSSA